MELDDDDDDRWGYNTVQDESEQLGRAQLEKGHPQHAMEFGL